MPSAFDAGRSRRLGWAAVLSTQRWPSKVRALTDPDTRPPWPAFLLYLALSVAFSGQIFSWRHLDSSGMMVGDPAVLAWALQWGSHALVTQPWNFFNGNAFYPFPLSVALGEQMFPLAVINILFRPFSDSPWFGYNLLIFLAYLLSAIGAYRLGTYLSGSRMLGFWAGIFWGFLFFRAHHFGHMTILSFQWIPYCLYYLLRLLEEPRPLYAWKLLFFYALQGLTSWYLGTATTVILGVCFVATASRRHFTRPYIKIYGRLLITACVVFLPSVLVYVWQSSHSTVRIRMASSRYYGDYVKLAEYFYFPDVTWLGSRFGGSWIWGERTLYIGYTAVCLAAIGVVSMVMRAWRRTPDVPPRRVPRFALAGLLLVVGGYLLALGYVSPTWGVRLPLSYAADWIPFIGGMRATQRLSLVLYMGILLLSLEALMLVARLPGRRWLPHGMVALCCGLYLFEVFPYRMPTNLTRRFAFEPIDVAIARLQRAAPRPLVVLHLPLYYFRGKLLFEWGPQDQKEAEYMTGSTLHWAKIVNGMHGEYPDGYRTWIGRLNEFPSEDAWALLRRIGVDLVAVHSAVEPDLRTRMEQFTRDHGGGPAFVVNANERLLPLCLRGPDPLLGCS